MSGNHLRSPILVTGATGFIGREVVRHLLASGHSVVAMARHRQGQSALARVTAAVGIVPDSDRLEVIEADLTCAANDLEESTRRRLQDTVETVMHCAGDTVFYPDDMASFRAGHIDGPLDLLHALHGGQLRRWAYLSTAYVCGRRSGTVLEREGDVGQDFHNPYERVKLQAEAAMRRAGARLGVDMRVFRPSVVVGAAPETMGGSPSNLLSTCIRLGAAVARLPNGSAMRLRIEGAPKAPFNVVPVEYVAAAMVTLAEHPDGAGQTFHLVISDPPTQEAVLAMIAKCLNLQGLSVIDWRCAPLQKPSLLERKVARMLSSYHDYLIQDVHFDDQGARRLLDCLGVARPTLLLCGIQRIINQALALPAPSCSA